MFSIRESDFISHIEKSIQKNGKFIAVIVNNRKWLKSLFCATKDKTDAKSLRLNPHPRIVYANGARVEFFTYCSPNKFRGYRQDEVIVDDCIPEKTLAAIIMPCVYPDGSITRIVRGV